MYVDIYMKCLWYDMSMNVYEFIDYRMSMTCRMNVVWHVIWMSIYMSYEIHMTCLWMSMNVYEISMNIIRHFYDMSYAIDI